MGLFDRKPPPQHERTEDDRERARAERAARRAKSLGLDDASPPPLELPPEDYGPYEGQVEAARALGVDPVAADDVANVSEAPAAEPEPEVQIAAPESEPLVEPLADPPDFAWHEPEPAETRRPEPDPEPEAAPPSADQPEPATQQPPARRPDPTRPTPGYRPEPPRDAARPASGGPTAIHPVQQPHTPASRYDSPSAVLDGPVAEDWSALDEPFAENGRDGEPPSRRRTPRAARPAREPGGRRRLGARVLALTAIAGVLIAVWLLFSLFEPLKGDATGKLVTVTVPKGASVGDVGDVLAERDIISSAFFFRLRSRISGKSTLLPGRYRLPQGMTYVAALDALAQGPPKVKTTPVTISEGRTRKEASRLLAETSLKGNYFNETRANAKTNAVLRPQTYGAPRKTASLEGFLFPATYPVRVGAPVADLVTQQLKTFKQRFAKIDLRYAKARKLSAYDVLIIASMVEREAQLDRERPMIAAVIYNRLRVGFPLGIDATLRYVFDDNENPLTQSQLDSSNAYNTRKRQGLPPTPIGNPGIESIRAAANPRKNSKVLYFVVKPCANGAHAFSNSLAQFNSDAAKYDAARAAKGGSPVKC